MTKEEYLNKVLISAINYLGSVTTIPKGSTFKRMEAVGTDDESVKR
jgi:hypothetical protein